MTQQKGLGSWYTIRRAACNLRHLGAIIWGPRPRAFQETRRRRAVSSVARPAARIRHEGAASPRSADANQSNVSDVDDVHRTSDIACAGGEQVVVDFVALAIVHLDAEGFGCLITVAGAEVDRVRASGERAHLEMEGTSPGSATKRALGCMLEKGAVMNSPACTLVTREDNPDPDGAQNPRWRGCRREARPRL